MEEINVFYIIVVSGILLYVGSRLGKWMIREYNIMTSLVLELENHLQEAKNIRRKSDDLKDNVRDTLRQVTSYEEGIIQQVLSSTKALIELTNKFPTLIADQFFMQNLNKIEQYENQILRSVEQYNNTVTRYNTAIAQFPSLIVASIFNFSKKNLAQVR